ncbi:MAG: phosphate/phosphite/phosphonate ABC transporter substrate-binding protein [Sphingomonas sp.]
MNPLHVVAILLVGVAATAGLWRLSPARPSVLRVVLIPADGGTEDGTIADYRPIFGAVARDTGLVFDLKVAQSYSAAVESLCNGTADIAFVGPVTFLQARKRGCAELLAVAVNSGKSVYYSAWFARRGSGIHTIVDARGRRLALGDVNSTSAFVYPVAMLLKAGIDPARDTAAIRLTGSHAGNLSALIDNRVDLAAMSLESYGKAVRAGIDGARDIVVVARSEPIPNPPLIMNTNLPEPTKIKLRLAFQTIADRRSVTPDMVRGYGGARVDRYDTKFPLSGFDGVAATTAQVSPHLVGRLLARASER